MAPWALSPIRGPNPQNPISIFTKLFGVRYVPDLGLLTTTLTGPPNEAIVQRTWGLLDGGKQYGPKFTFHEYQRASNQLLGIIVHFAIQLGMMSLLISPLRWLLMRLVTSPGDGPAKEKREKELLEYRAIGTADQNVPKPKRAYARFRWDGGIYDLTGVFLAEAAMAILQDTDLERKLGGGVLTPAMLGQPFVDRLKNVGCTFETEIMPDH